jgi:hypothetical protein
VSSDFGISRGGTHLDAFANLFESRHPAGIEMAVVEQDPLAGLSCVTDYLLCNGALVLAQTDRLHIELALLSSKVGQLLGGVRAWQNEDQRSRLGRVAVALLDVENRWGQELLAHFFCHVLHDGSGELIWPHRFQDAQLHEGRPLAGDILIVGWEKIFSQSLTLVEGLPVILVLVHRQKERSEHYIILTDEIAKLVPDCRWKPLAGVLLLQGVLKTSHILDEKTVLHTGEHAFRHLDHEGQQEREEELVFLKDGATHI